MFGADFEQLLLVEFLDDPVVSCFEIGEAFSGPGLPADPAQGEQEPEEHGKDG